MLVQTRVFDEIDEFFLIVGHTHCLVDQYFSVLSGAIHKSMFIGKSQSKVNITSRSLNDCFWAGTPLAMQWRVSHAHEDAKNFPILSRQINVRGLT